MNYKVKHESRYSQRFRIVAWVNVITQLLFPITAAFTPILVSANSQPQSQVKLLSPQLQPYRLLPGQTVTSVAKI